MTWAEPQRFAGPFEPLHTGRPEVCLLRGSFRAELYDDRLFPKAGITLPHPLTSAGQTRKAEFLAGRLAVAGAFEALALSRAEVGVGPDRAPQWPPMVRGSITHATDLCACLVSRDAALSPGIDIEQNFSDSAYRSISDHVLSEAERALVVQLPEAERPRIAVLVFSAKESLFKALFPIVGRHFGFDCAEMSGRPSAGRIVLRLTQTLGHELLAGRSFVISYLTTHDHVLTWLIASVSSDRDAAGKVSVPPAAG